ncbi:hypothetical protein [Peribacillus asahii]|uniref:hypothetical protein n=1 Tax=Peribacillus asahii TaxID=228899 RepID=UPI00207A0DEC|nr:hypothetical protein [Peribacillus asahii]USK84776.1 hypothetical protein LIT35_20695 [Peribacillus asahii]
MATTETITGKETIGVAWKHYGTDYENNTGGEFDLKQEDQFVSYFVKQIEQVGNLGA